MRQHEGGSSRLSLRNWLGRLRYFSIALPTRRDGDGERLELVFQVAGREGIEDVLARLNTPWPKAARVPVSDEDSLTLGVDGLGTAEIDGILLQVNILNEDELELSIHPVENGWRLSEVEVAQAERIEAVLDAAGLQRLPRLSDRTGWIHPTRNPELF